MPDAGTKEADEVEWQNLQSVVMDSLGAVEVIVLLRCHNGILDFMLLPQRDYSEDLPEVQ